MKVVFLEIDGPIIPAAMYLVSRMCSYERIMSLQAVAVVREICKISGAKLVINSTHNREFANVPGIEEMLVRHGMPAEGFHPDSRTSYPGIPRDLAVTKWLAEHPEVTDWVALDYVDFPDIENFIYVDPDCGLGTAHLNQALGALGEEPLMFLI